MKPILPKGSIPIKLNSDFKNIPKILTVPRATTILVIPSNVNQSIHSPTVAANLNWSTDKDNNIIKHGPLKISKNGCFISSDISDIKKNNQHKTFEPIVFSNKFSASANKHCLYNSSKKVDGSDNKIYSIKDHKIESLNLSKKRKFKYSDEKRHINTNNYLLEKEKLKNNSISHIHFNKNNSLKNYEVLKSQNTPISKQLGKNLNQNENKLFQNYEIFSKNRLHKSFTNSKSDIQIETLQRVNSKSNEAKSEDISTKNKMNFDSSNNPPTDDKPFHDYKGNVSHNSQSNINVRIGSPPSYESHLCNSSPKVVNKMVSNFSFSDVCKDSQPYENHDSSHKGSELPPSYPELQQENALAYKKLKLSTCANKNLLSKNTNSLDGGNNLCTNGRSCDSSSNLPSCEMSSEAARYNSKPQDPISMPAPIRYKNTHLGSHYEEEPTDYSSNSVTNSSGLREKEKFHNGDTESSAGGRTYNMYSSKEENESSFEERRKLAINLLSSSAGTDLKRQETLKENFWIVEDEPLEKTVPENDDQNQKDSQPLNDHSLARNPSRKSFVCHICGKVLKGRSSLRSHIHLHMGLKPYKCIYCSKTFTQSCVLKNHLRTHTGETPYTCSTCNNSFKTLSILRKHMSTHNTIRSFKCVVCPKTFKNKVNLQTHLKIHISEPHFCRICKTLFDSRRSLSTHVNRKHKTRSVFPCTLCNKTYEFRSLLKQHLRVHTNERRHSCHVCGSTFVWKSGLVAHMRTHSFRLQCEICGLKFIYLKKLESHRIRHSDPFPYKCSKCKKDFKYAYLLKAHLSKHKDDLSCPSCNIGFMTKSKFKKHLKTHE